MDKLKKKSGFTITEVIVIIAIVAIIAAIALPSIPRFLSKSTDIRDIIVARKYSDIIEEYTILEGRKPNDREEIYTWLKKISPDIKLTTNTEGYYLWYNIEKNRIELKQYLDIALNSNPEVKEPSNIVDNYLFLNDDTSPLSMAIKNVEEGNINAIENIKVDYQVAHTRLLKYISDAGLKQTYTVVLKDNQGMEIETLKVEDKAKAEPTFNVLKSEEKYKYAIITNWISQTEGITDLTSITKDCSFIAEVIEITIEIYNDDNEVGVGAYLMNGEIIEDVRFETENNLVKVYVYDYFIDSIINNE